MIGFVVPTMGTREANLTVCIQSLKENDVSNICVVVPAYAVDDIAAKHPEVRIVVDSRRGLAAAINDGIRTFPRQVRYVNWLGDDDRLLGGSMAELQRALEDDSDSVLAHGMCEYVNSKGDKLFLNRSAKWSEQLMRFGPQLVSQPAVLFARESFDRVGGLDESLSFAFDLDLFLKLRGVGRFVRVPITAARYCWHEEALTVASRRSSVIEASKVRMKHVPRKLRWLVRVWEYLIRSLIFVAGRILSTFAKYKSKP